MPLKRNAITCSASEQNPRAFLKMLYDVFVSHSSQTKEVFSDEFATTLRSYGLRVWYDDFVLKPGDSLSERLDAGIAASDYGIVIFSKDFFERFWTKQELRGIRAIENSDNQKIIPVWLDVDREFVAQHSPILADRIAITVGDDSPNIAAYKALSVIKPAVFSQIQSTLQFLKNMDGASVVNIDPNELERSPVRHESFSLHVHSRLRLLQASLESVYPGPIETWMDNFSRDMHPHQELLWWELLAATFHKVKNKIDWPDQEVFDALLVMMLSGEVGKINSIVAEQDEGVANEIVSVIESTTEIHKLTFGKFRFEAMHPQDQDK